MNLAFGIETTNLIQTRFVHGRYLAETNPSIWAGVEEGPKGGDHILLIVHFEKAYDILEWRFLEA